MYFILILFFISLFGIAFMIGRKLIKLQRGEIVAGEKVSLEIPYLGEIKQITIQNIKKHHHIGLVAIIRFYVRASNFIKSKYQVAETKMLDILTKNSNGDFGEKRETSKFLKVISEYKHKVRELKHKIKEEELKK